MNKQTLLALVLTGLFSQPLLAETTDSSTTTSTTTEMTSSDDSGTSETMETLVEEGSMPESGSSPQAESQAISKISNDFSGLLGDSATDAVTGLRNGDEFTLTKSYTDAEGVQTTETVTIDPPTGKMGLGNVSISLALAQNNLTQLGITDPSLLDLEAALLGGSITTTDGQVIELDGVLTLRSDGMGWGKIAQQYDTKLGHVMSALKAGKVYTAPTTSSTASGSTSGTGETSTVQNAHGASPKSHATHTSNGYAFGQGIVTAGGSSIGSISSRNAASHGQGNAYGHASSGGQGIVSGGGTVHGNAGGNGHGKALGKTR